jgi:hypothetical protein
MERGVPGLVFRRRRVAAVLLFVLGLFGAALHEGRQTPPDASKLAATAVQVKTSPAIEALGSLAIKGRAPKIGYSRAQFGSGWGEVEDCDTRNWILQRDLVGVRVSPDGCIVERGTLDDPYTGQAIEFVRGPGTSSKVQIDHVVALSDGWQKGAQQLDEGRREQFGNDPLNLLAVDGPTNIKKGGSDAASWLPPNKTYRCRYVARQVAVKARYALWVTQAEFDAIKRVLQGCPDQQLPAVK